MADDYVKQLCRVKTMKKNVKNTRKKSALAPPNFSGFEPKFTSRFFTKLFSVQMVNGTFGSERGRARK